MIKRVILVAALSLLAFVPAMAAGIANAPRPTPAWTEPVKHAALKAEPVVTEPAPIVLDEIKVVGQKPMATKRTRACKIPVRVGETRTLEELGSNGTVVTWETACLPSKG